MGNLIDYIKNKLNKSKEEVEYELLSPKEDIDIKTKDALDFAFRNKKAKNIAITGNYSSGKSSVILSYLKAEKIKMDEVVRISLGTFLYKQKENEDKKNNIENDEDEITSINVETLEKYIINQIYFGTFNRIKQNSNKVWNVISIELFLFIISIISFIKKDIIAEEYIKFYWNVLKYFNFDFLLYYIIIFLFISLISFSTIYLIKQVIQIGVKFKMTVQYKDMKFELENNKNDDVNMINRNIEQIVDMLKKSNCKYVIFEDIDRFNKPEVFEHLKELNDIINNTRKMKFIYLIKDDVFGGENRTKFFDYIYPIVPYVSYGNSGEEFYKIIESYKLTDKIPKDFIIKISSYIQDMRIFKNTLNEFRVYSKDINTEGIDYKNLFSIILYKNVFSEDFAKLQNREGNLYELFRKKDEIVNDIKKTIIELKRNSEESRTEKDIVNNIISNIKRRAEIMEKSVTLYNPSVGQITLDNNILGSFLVDENTEVYFDGEHYMNISEFINSYGSNGTINEFKKMLESSSKKREEKERDLNEQIRKLYNLERYSMADLLIRGNISEEEFIIFNCSSQKNIMEAELVQFLLREGYIKEDYERYITKFHSGTLTPNDNNFKGYCQINNVKDFLLELDNAALVIKELDEKYFLNQAVLNINISKCISDEKNSSKKEKYISTFLSSSKIIEYLKEINNRFSREELINFYTLLSGNHNAYITINELVDKKDKANMLRYFLLYSNISNINLQEKIMDLKAYIENENLLLADTEEMNSIKEIIKQLNIKYTDLTNALKGNQKLFELCLENNNYKINIENIKCIIRQFTDNLEFENDIDLKNDLTIFSDYITYDYIKENIIDYIENVYMAHENDNDENIIIDLLNNDTIKKYWSEIISRESKTTQYKITYLSKIKNESLYNDLLKNNLVAVTIENINTYYKSRIYNDDGDKEETYIENSKEVLIEFINNNYSKLSGEKTSDKKYYELRNYIFVENRLLDNAYKAITEYFDVRITNMDITGLSENKIIHLIDSDKIALNEKMYGYIRSCGERIFVAFTYAKRKLIFVNTAKYNFSLNEISILLTNRQYNLNFNYKHNLIYSISEYENIEEDDGVTNEIIKYIINKQLTTEYSIKQIEVLIRNCTSDELKISFLTHNMDKLDKDELRLLFITYIKDEDYRKILENRKKPKFKNAYELKIFIDASKEKGFNIQYEMKDNLICIKGTVR